MQPCPQNFTILNYVSMSTKERRKKTKEVGPPQSTAHIKSKTSLLSAAAAKSLQSCPTLCDPIDGSHQAPPSLGFSRQEHWSGLPFSSPMCESEK